MKNLVNVMIKKTGWAILLLAASVCTPVMADGYELELIFFEHKYPDTAGEHFPLAQALSALPDEGLLLFKGPSHFRPGYHPLPETQLMHQQEYALLMQSVEYEPIWHGGWRQPAVNRSESIALRQLTACGGGLAGTVRLRDKGSLHLELDVHYQPCATDAEQSGTWSILVQHRRRVLLNRLYYLDHPLLGALFEVRRN